jgi:response regulator NasT
MNAESTTLGPDPTEELRLQRDEVEQLREALASRAVIDQANGILTGRFGNSADGAVALLTRVRQDHNHRDESHPKDPRGSAA